LSLLLALYLTSLILYWKQTILVTITTLSIIYLLDVIFTFVIIYRSFAHSPEITIPPATIKELDEASLPTYSILCPLYREPEVVEQFINAINQLDWPADKKDVQLLIEQDDTETQGKLAQLTLPTNFTVRIVPPRPSPNQAQSLQLWSSLLPRRICCYLRRRRYS